MKRGVRIANGDWLWMRYRIDWSEWLENAVGAALTAVLLYISRDEVLSFLSRVWWSL